MPVSRTRKNAGKGKGAQERRRRRQGNSTTATSARSCATDRIMDDMALLIGAAAVARLRRKTRPW